MKSIDKDTNKDAILLYLQSPDSDIVDLSPKQKQLLDYYTQAYDMIRNYNSVPDVIAMLVKTSAMRGEPISRSTARRYVYDAQDVFGYSSKTKAEAIIHLSTEFLMDAIAMARDQNKPEIIIAGVKELIKASGADKVEGFNPEMIERHIIELSLDKKGQKVIDLIASKGVVDLDVLMGNALNSLAEDAVVIASDDTEH